MQRPEQVKFSSLVLDDIALAKLGNAGINEVAEDDWARLHFKVPTARDAIQDVYDWLSKNCKGSYVAYKFYDTKDYSQYKMVVRFASKNDAILFKLQDGHRAWEHKGQE